MTNAWALKPPAAPIVLGSSTAAAAGFSWDSLFNDYLGVVAKAVPSSGTVRLVLDFGASPPPIDAMLFFGCTGAVAGWQITVNATPDGTIPSAIYSFGPGTFLAGATMPSHGRGVGYWEKAGGPVTTRYWVVDFTGLGTTPFIAGRLAIGQKLQLGRNFGFGGGWGVRDLGSVDWSPAGNLLRRRAAKLRTIGLTFPNVYKSEVEQNVLPLIELAGGQEPIALVTDPAADAQRQTRCYFGPMIGELGTVWRVPNGWEWRANLVDLVPIPKAS